MPEKLSGLTQKHLESVCQKVAVSNQLDAQIAEELRGHMEDKLHAYLDGQEKLTENDALLLVEKHFGDMALIQSMFRKVHAGSRADSFGRRLTAMLVVACAGVVANELLVFLTGITLLRHWGNLANRYTEFEITFDLIKPVVIPLITTTAMWLILRAWQQRAERGRLPWFYRWGSFEIAFVAVAAVFFMSQHLSSTTRLHWQPRWFSFDQTYVIRSEYYPQINWGGSYWLDSETSEAIFAQLRNATSIVNAILWIWWFGQQRTRRFLAVAAGMGLWIAWSFFQWILGPGYPWVNPGFWHYGILPHAILSNRLLGNLNQLAEGRFWLEATILSIIAMGLYLYASVMRPRPLAEH